MAVIDSEHRSSIKYLEWNAGGHALISVDYTGEFCIWAMKVRTGVNHCFLSMLLQ